MAGAVILTVVAIVSVVVIFLCGRARIARNPFVGIRLPAFFSSDQAWQIGHQAAVVPLVVASIATAAVAVLAYVVPPFGGTATPTLINCGVLLAGLIVGAVRGSRAIARDMSATGSSTTADR